MTWDTVRPQATGRWTAILDAIGIDAKFLRKKHGPCPICGGKDRFRFDDKNGSGSWFCSHCGAGDGFILAQLYRKCSPLESLRLVSDVLGCKEIAKIPQRLYTTISPASNQKLILAKREQLQKTWNEAKKITPGDPVHTYLTVTRKLPLVDIPAVLRIHPDLPYYNEDYKCLGNYPTMLAMLENINGELVSLHRTYLTSEGHKAPVPEPKKLMPAIYERATTGAAIRLYQPTDVLILAEGIETAFWGALCLGLPAWACRCDHGLATVRLPDSVRKITVLVDNDASGAGQQAASTLAIRMKKEGRLIKRLMPHQPGNDWLDVAVSDG